MQWQAICFVAKCNRQIKQIKNLIITKAFLCDSDCRKKNIQFPICQFAKKKRENFFCARFYYPYDRLNRPIASRKLDFFFPSRKIKSSFLLSYLSAAKVKVVRKSSFMIWITKIVRWKQFSHAPCKKNKKNKNHPYSIDLLSFDVYNILFDCTQLWKKRYPSYKVISIALYWSKQWESHVTNGEGR